MITREEMTTVLNATGVRWKWGFSPCHWNVIPPSNLAPWDADEQDALESAVVDFLGERGGVTSHLVKQSGRWFEDFVAKPGKGFRIWTK